MMARLSGVKGSSYHVPVTDTMLQDMAAWRAIWEDFEDRQRFPRSRWPQSHPNYHGNPHEGERFCPTCERSWEDEY